MTVWCLTPTLEVCQLNTTTRFERSTLKHKLESDLSKITINRNKVPARLIEDAISWIIDENGRMNGCIK